MVQMTRKPSEQVTKYPLWSRKIKVFIVWQYINKRLMIIFLVFANEGEFINLVC